MNVFRKIIETIRRLIVYLPKRDIQLGYKFLNRRDFDSLKELIDSAIYKVEKNLASENPKDEYINLDLDMMNELQQEVYLYAINLELPDNEDDYNNYDDF